jgi:hypothetical protein
MPKRGLQEVIFAFSSLSIEARKLRPAISYLGFEGHKPVHIHSFYLFIIYKI